VLFAQIPSISKNIDYNPDGMLFVICDDVTEVVEALGDDIEYMLSKHMLFIASIYQPATSCGYIQ
jgi:hypothetical protein